MLGSSLAGLAMSTAVGVHGGGETLTLRRSLMLFDPVNDTGVRSLQLVEAAVAGASALKLSRSSGALSGVVPEGLGLVIGGAAYKVAADAQARGHEVEVEVSPALAVGYGQATAVELDEFADFTYLRVRMALSFRDAGLDNVQDGDERFGLLPKGSAVAPRMGDKVSDGTNGSIVHVQPLAPGRKAAGWVVQVGARDGVR